MTTTTTACRIHAARDDVLSVVVFGSVPEVLVPATVIDAQARPTRF